MPASGPSFSPYPFERLRRITRRDAAFESALARHLAARTHALPRLEALVGGPVRARVVGVGPGAGDRHSATLRDATRPGEARAFDRHSATLRDAAFDPHAARAELRCDGSSLVLAAPARAIRALAARWLGGPDELAAPRPLTAVEHGVWCLVLATALADLGIAADVWPLLDEPTAIDDARSVELAVELGDVALTVMAVVPHAIELRVPPPRAVPPWTFELPVVVARVALPRAAIGRLAVRDIVTVESPGSAGARSDTERRGTIERGLELEIGDGVVRLDAAPGAVEATVATGYVRRDMALPDDAHLELSVQLGTTRLSLRQLAELAVGQVVPLGRPLAGPFEVRAGGRVIGQGELIDIDGELGVRIVSLAQE